MTAPHVPESDPLPKRTRALLLVLPFVALVGAWFVARILTDANRAGQMAAAAFASFAGLGTTVIFGSAVLGESSFIHLKTLELAIVVLVLNTSLAVVFVGAFDLLERIPVLGPRLSSARGAARAVVGERPWIRRWATAGVALFVISPLPGSGSLGGTLVGRIVGLTRIRTFISVATANAIVCAVYALGADALEQWMRRSRMSTAQRVGLVVVALVLVLGLLKWIVTKAAAPVTPPTPPPAPPPPPPGP